MGSHEQSEIKSPEKSGVSNKVAELWKRMNEGVPIKRFNFVSESSTASPPKKSADNGKKDHCIPNVQKQDSVTDKEEAKRIASAALAAVRNATATAAAASSRGKIETKGVMAVREPSIGLKWEPKLPGISLESKTGSGSIKEAERHKSGSLWSSESELVDGLCLPPNDPRKVNKMVRKQIKDTAGSNWFDMPAPTMTPELKRDLQMLKLRNVMDPKQHYKKAMTRSKLGEKYFQIGTVIDRPEDFYGRVTKKNRKTSLAEELVSDHKASEYRKRKVREIEEKHRAVEHMKWKKKKSQPKNTKLRRS